MKKRVGAVLRAMRSGWAAALMLLPLPALPQSPSEEAAPILIAHVTPSSGRFSIHAEADRRGVQMAIDEFNAAGGVLGREVVLVMRDPTLDTEQAARVAADLITRNRIGFMVGAIHSGVAAAMSAVCQRHGVIFINTNSSAVAESGANAHRTKFVFDGTGANFGRALIEYAVADRASKRTLLLTEDYVWGHSNAAALRRYIAEAGGEVVDEIIVPEALNDPRGVLERVEAVDADVVVVNVSGGNQVKLFAQADREMLERRLWILNEVDWPELYTAPGTMRPLFGTTWSWNLDTPGTAEFVARYRQRYGRTTLDYPGDVVHSAYIAAKALFHSIERAGTTDNHAVIRELEGYRWSAEERMQSSEAHVDPVSHHVQQSIYIARWNPSAKHPKDGIEIVGHIPPERARDDEEERTRLESFDDTPRYAP